MTTWFTLYELIPAPYGTRYREIITRDRLIDLYNILSVIKQTDVNFELYEIYTNEGLKIPIKNVKQK